MTEPRSKLGIAAALATLIVASGCAGSSSVRQHDLKSRAGPRPIGTIYLVDRATATGGEAVTTVNVAQAQTRTRRARELSPGDPPFMIAVVSRRVVLFGSQQTYATGLDLAEPARSLGPSWFFIPAASLERVWLVHLDSENPATAHRLGGVREVTVDGTVALERSNQLPGQPVAAVDSGLLVQTKRLEVWQPATGRVIRELEGIFPLATQRAMAATCDQRCSVLHVTDTNTGRDRVIAPGNGFHFVASYHGAFSPDGKLLAVQATTNRGGNRVAIINIAKRIATLLPGGMLATDYPLMTWSSSGWLFFNAGHGRLGAYGADIGRAILLRFRLAPFEAMTST